MSDRREKQIYRLFEPKMMTLSPTDPTMSYDPRAAQVLKSSKWRQMKLLIATVNWLVNHWNRRTHPEIILVVYDGVPGSHYATLAEMFPEIKEIHLWNGTKNKFSEFSHPRITFHNSKLTLQEAENYRDVQDRLFFVSDINLSFDSKEYSEDRIRRFLTFGLGTQRNILEELNPVSSLLKFKLPYLREDDPAEKFEYLAGTVYLPSFASPTTTETFLVPRREPETREWITNLYSIAEYEGKLCHFNLRVRSDYGVRDKSGGKVTTRWLNHLTKSTAVPDETHLINSYDTMMMIYVFDRYLLHIRGYTSMDPTERFLKVMAMWNWARDNVISRMGIEFSLKDRRLMANRNPSFFANDLDDDQVMEFFSQTEEPEAVTIRQPEYSSRIPSLPGSST